jgi:hypothetical protein
VLKQASSGRQADGCVGIVKAYFEKWKDREGDFAQRFGGEESRLWLLIVQQRLKDRKRLLIGRCAQRLCSGCANGRIWMPRQVGGDQHGSGIAQS